MLLISGLRDENSHLYQAISDERAENFIIDGLAYAIPVYGPPRKAIAEVRLRRSTPIHPRLNLPKDFACVRVANKAKGIFTIYTYALPDEIRFWPLLGHEILHLIDTDYLDCYIEGLCTVFAESFLSSKGIDWTPSAKFFSDGQAPFYAFTYEMMKLISNAAGAQHMYRFFTAKSFHGDRGYIDIDNWLRLIEADRATEVKSIIKQFRMKILDARKKSNLEWLSFINPS